MDQIFDSVLRGMKLLKHADYLSRAIIDRPLSIWGWTLAFLVVYVSAQIIGRNNQRQRTPEWRVRLWRMEERLQQLEAEAQLRRELFEAASGR